LPKLHGDIGTSTPLESKSFLIGGLTLLIVSLICTMSVRIFAQQFMEYEILLPQTDVDRYFEGRVPFTQSYRLNPGSFAWQSLLTKVLIFLAALFFIFGLSLAVIFLYQNLP
jgi:hypothetical protein